MADLFGGLSNLGGLMKGLTNFMPQDDPNTQVLKSQTEVSDLKKQEESLYIEIGKIAEKQYGLDSFGELADRMRLVRSNLASAENKLKEAQGIAEEKNRAEKAAKAGRTCSSCGYENPEGVKFCQECGSKLGGAVCPSCGTANAAGIRFCQECGARLETAPASAVCPACGEQNPPGTRFCGGCGNRLEG